MTTPHNNPAHTVPRSHGRSHSNRSVATTTTRGADSTDNANNSADTARNDKVVAEARRNKKVTHWIGGVVTLAIIAYTAYMAYKFYPEYTNARDNSITLHSLLALTVTVGNVYFALSFPIVHYSAARLKGIAKAPVTDFLITLTKIVMFAVWVYVSLRVYNAPTEDYDDVEKLIILGVFGASYFLFDVVYILIVYISRGVKALAFTRRKKAHKKKKKPKPVTAAKQEKVKGSGNDNTHNRTNSRKPSNDYDTVPQPRVQ